MVTGHCGGASFVELKFETRSSWLNCALRDDEAVFWVSIGQKQMVIDDTGSEEGIYAFIYCTKWRSGQVSRMPHSLTD